LLFACERGRRHTLREECLREEAKRNQAAAAVLVSGLQQCLLSCLEAFALTRRVHHRAVERQQQQDAVQAEA